MIVYRTTDRVDIKIGEVIVQISPLNYQQKSEILGFTKMQSGQEVVDGSRMALHTLKCCVKGINAPNVEYPDGSSFSLSFDEDKILTDDSLSELLQILSSEKLIMIASKLLNQSVQDVDAIEGVELVTPEVTSIKKKPRKQVQA